MRVETLARKSNCNLDYIKGSVTEYWKVIRMFSCCFLRREGNLGQMNLLSHPLPPSQQRLCYNTGLSLTDKAAAPETPDILSVCYSGRADEISSLEFWVRHPPCCYQATDNTQVQEQQTPRQWEGNGVCYSNQYLSLCEGLFKCYIMSGRFYELYLLFKPEFFINLNCHL